MAKINWEEIITLEEVMNFDINQYEGVGALGSSSKRGSNLSLFNMGKEIAEKIQAIIRIRGRLMHTCVFVSKRNGSVLSNTSPIDAIDSNLLYGIEKRECVKMSVGVLIRHLKSKHHIFRLKCPDCSDMIRFASSLSGHSMGLASFHHSPSVDVSFGMLQMILGAGNVPKMTGLSESPSCKYIDDASNSENTSKIILPVRDLPIWNPTWRIR